MSKIGKTVKKLRKTLCNLRQDILRLNCRSACIHVVQQVRPHLYWSLPLGQV